MDKSSKGFTLIELIAVLAIISIMLFFTLPQFDIFSQTDDIKGVSRWLIATVPQLKSKSMSEQKTYILTVDLDQDRFLIIQEALQPVTESVADDETDANAPEATEFQLSENITITDVIFPIKGVVRSGAADINFYPKGYSDRVIIHITDADNDRRSFLIEPFLNRVEIFNGYLDFSQVLMASGSK